MRGARRAVFCACCAIYLALALAAYRDAPPTPDLTAAERIAWAAAAPALSILKLGRYLG